MAPTPGLAPSSGGGPGLRCGDALQDAYDTPEALCTTSPADLAAVVPSAGTGATAAGCDVTLASGSSGAPPGAGVSGGGGDRPVGGGVLLGVLG